MTLIAGELLVIYFPFEVIMEMHVGCFFKGMILHTRRSLVEMLF